MGLSLILLIYDVNLNPAAVVLDDVFVVKVGEYFDFVEESVDGFDKVGFALIGLDFDDFEGVELMVEFAVDLMHFGEPSCPDSTHVYKLLLKTLH